MTHDAARHAQGLAAPATTPVAEIALRGEKLVVRARRWPNRPDVAQLVLYQQAAMPTLADLQRWSAELARQGFRAVRTTAVTGTAAQRMETAGFRSIQELVLLQHESPRSVADEHRDHSGIPLRRLAPVRFAAAAAVDEAAFGLDWSLDAGAIADVCGATPRHRARSAGGAAFTAYAISGRDARQGFLQRLAVHPSAQRNGLGRALALDSLRWAGRWRVERVLVNTHVSNEPALALYESIGFRRMRERLHVYERMLA